MSDTPILNAISRLVAEQKKNEKLRAKNVALREENVALRSLLNEPYQFFSFGHKSLQPWGKHLERWCEKAEKLGFQKTSEAMSDTPRTDANCGWPIGQHGRISSSDLQMQADGPFVHASFARELERENAELREDKERLDWLETHLQHVAEVGNPQMDGTRFVGQHRDATGRQHCRMSGRSMRAAIDAARKEAQP